MENLDNKKNPVTIFSDKFVLSLILQRQMWSNNHFSVEAVQKGSTWLDKNCQKYGVYAFFRVISKDDYLDSGKNQPEPSFQTPTEPNI